MNIPSYMRLLPRMEALSDTTPFSGFIYKRRKKL
jgi:hypothetical protein